MYLLIEGKEPSTYEMIECEIAKAITRVSGDQWELVGVGPDDSEISIAKFDTDRDAYKALRQLFDHISEGSEVWDVIEFKEYLKSPSAILGSL